MGSTVNLNIITLNVRGIIAVLKRQKLFIWFKKQDADIVFIQETHCTKAKHGIFINDWNGLSLYSLTNSTFSRGVGILIKKTVVLK